MKILIATLLLLAEAQSTPQRPSVGVYVYESSADKMREELRLEVKGSKLVGTYQGQDRTEGTLSYYSAPLTDLTIAEGRIAFKIGEHELRKAPQYGHRKAVGSSIGVDKSVHMFRGTFTAEEIRLTCSDSCVFGDGEIVLKRVISPTETKG
jgi:hypothetical protein